MIPQIRKYFLITVHYGDPQTTHNLLSSIEQNTLKPERIVVIDHGITPYHPTFPRLPVTVIRPHENNGYAGGINTAVGYLHQGGIEAHDIFICINNDTVLPSDGFECIKQWSNQQSVVGIAGPAMSHLNLFSGRTHIGEAPRLPWHLPYIDGALFVTSVKTFFAAKGMPDQLFMYWEDVEFSRRAVKAGYPLQQITNLSVSHKITSQSTDQEKIYYLVRNGAWYGQHQTPHIYKLYWYALNRLRFFLHTYITHKIEVTKALQDAMNGTLQKRPI